MAVDSFLAIFNNEIYLSEDPLEDQVLSNAGLRAMRRDIRPMSWICLTGHKPGGCQGHA